MDRKRELLKEILSGVGFRFGFRGTGRCVSRFHPFSHPTKTKCERLRRVVVAEFHQQSPNRSNAASGAPDEANGFHNGLLLFTNSLEQETFELAAIGGSFRIDPTVATGSQGATRL